MSNSLYNSARKLFLEGSISFPNDNIKICILNQNYVGGTTAITTHSTYADVAPYVLTGTIPVRTLLNKITNAGGVAGTAGASAVQFSSITGGQIASYLCIFKDKNVSAIDGAPSDTSSPLIALFDAFLGGGSGTAGSDILISFDTNGIFRI